MPVSESRKMSALFLGTVLLLGTLAAFAPAMLGSRKIQRFCEALPLGAAEAEVQAKTAAEGYSFTKLVDGTVAVEHGASLGRLECQLRFDGQGKLASKTRPP
jgi:hypothetical protein